MAKSSRSTSAAAVKTAGDGTNSPQLLERTFSVLALFASERAQWTTTEISQECGLPVPTVHRIVVALSNHGFLVRDLSNKRFRLGPTAIALGRAALSANDLQSVAAGLLPTLTANTEETSLLTVPTATKDGSVCLVRMESPHPLRLSVEPGRFLPLHAGANQKVILAFLPPEAQERVLAEPLEAYCKNTLVEPADLRKEIAVIKKRGWAYSREETNPGVWGVAIALLDASGEAVGAVGIAGPQVRLSRQAVRASLDAIQQTALELASTLGLASSCTGDISIPARLAVNVPN